MTFDPVSVRQKILEKEVAQTTAMRSRQEILTEWSRATVEELVTFLEVGKYEEPMVLRDCDVIVSHLWMLHRDELTPTICGRLQSLIGTERLHEDAAKFLRIFLIALDCDDVQLKAIWLEAPRGRDLWLYCYYDLMEAFAFLGCADAEIVRGCIDVFDMEMMFSGKFHTMLNLGRMGQVAASAADTIRRVVYDSEPYIIAARDQVLQRLTTSDDDWKRCTKCSYGRVHSPDSFGASFCDVCAGIGYVRKTA